MYIVTWHASINLRWTSIGGSGGGGGCAAQTVEADFSAVSTERSSLILPISVRTVLEAWTLSPPRRVLNLASSGSSVVGGSKGTASKGRTLPHAQPLPEGVQGMLKRRSSKSENAGETSESRGR